MCVFSVAVHKCSPTLEDENIQVALISMHLGVLNPSRSKKVNIAACVREQLF